MLLLAMVKHAMVRYAMVRHAMVMCDKLTPMTRSRSYCAAFAMIVLYISGLGENNTAAAVLPCLLALSPLYI